MSKLIKFLLIIISLLVVFNSEIHAATITTDSCSQADIQTAIDSANDGDIVKVPAGTCIWSSKVLISGKGVTVKGAGIGKTIIKNQITGTSSYDSAFRVIGKNGKPWRITGFEIVGVEGYPGGSINAVGVYITGNSKNWRVDNNKFNKLNGRVIWSNGSPTYGLIDHNIFDMLDGFQGMYIKNLNMGGESQGNGDWMTSSSIGTEEAVYVEDNTFNYPEPNKVSAMIDCNGGGRFVVRYNTIINTTVHAHGGGDSPGSSEHRSCRQWEIYHNNISFNKASNHPAAITLRGGTGVIFNNEVEGNFNNFAKLACYRVGFTDPEKDGPWGQCNGSSLVDGNTSGMNGYPCLDCPGRGQDSGIGTTQALEPVYSWNNTLNGVSKDAFAQYPTHTILNTDYYNGVQKPGYTPYTYPHPLTIAPNTTAPNPPTNLR